MEVRAKLSNLRIAPRKVRLVADMVRGKKTEQAEKLLTFAVKRASNPILRLLKQAVANAQNNFQLDPANLFIKKIFVDEGPKFKRWRARSRGQAYEIQKKTSHITIILDEKIKGKKKKTAKKEVAVEKPETETKKEIKTKTERPDFKPRKETARPTSQKGLNKIFRRKAV